MSLLRETLESGKFAVTTEMAPPKGTDLSHLIECAKPLVGRVHAKKCNRLSIGSYESNFSCYM